MFVAVHVDRGEEVADGELGKEICDMPLNHSLDMEENAVERRWVQEC